MRNFLTAWGRFFRAIAKFVVYSAIIRSHKIRFMRHKKRCKQCHAVWHSPFLPQGALCDVGREWINRTHRLIGLDEIAKIPARPVVAGGAQVGVGFSLDDILDGIDDTPPTCNHESCHEDYARHKAAQEKKVN